jgi:hypothetical protein
LNTIFYSGLKYDDLLIDEYDMTKGLSRVPRELQIERYPIKIFFHRVAVEFNFIRLFLSRERRIHRAFDLSAKRKTLPDEVSAAYDPFDVRQMHIVYLPCGCFSTYSCFFYCSGT